MKKIVAMPLEGMRVVASDTDERPFIVVLQAMGGSIAEVHEFDCVTAALSWISANSQDEFDSIIILNTASLPSAGGQ